MYDHTLYTLGWTHKRLHLPSPERTMLELVRQNWNAPRILGLREFWMRRRKLIVYILAFEGLSWCARHHPDAFALDLILRILAAIITKDLLG